MRSLLLAAALAAALPAAAEEEVGIGLPAPSFSLRALNPEVAGTGWIALDRYVGEGAEDPAARVVLLSFFASWCEPCRRELPFLVELDRAYRDHGLRILAVDLDKEEAGIAAARKLLAANGVRYPVLSDRFNLLARRYLGDQAPLPSVFLVRRDGLVSRIERGYAKDSPAFLLAEVQDALGLAPKDRAHAAGRSPSRQLAGGSATPAAPAR